MEKILQVLCEIEEKATAILDHSAEEKKHLNELQEQKMAAFREELNVKTAQTLEELRIEMEQKNQITKQELFDNNEKNLKKLEKDFNIHQDAYIDEIFQSIISSNCL